MPIAEIMAGKPAALELLSIEQIVGICGDGKLKDHSVCSSELRQFLTSQSVERIADHARHCLENKFDKSGFVLQDVVNEIGRRLGYTVDNGRYHGVQNQPGHDGLWKDDDGRQIVVEVKTTDAYRINLDTVCKYGEMITGSSKAHNTLIVVGREDTGDLEAQVRGSRHAWNVRLISVDALVKMMLIKNEATTYGLVDKIRRVLLPIEFTRVDNIIDLVFEVQKEKDFVAAVDLEIGDGTTDVPDDDSKTALKTDIAVINKMRSQIATTFFKNLGISNFAQQKKKALFSGLEVSVNICVAVSRNYFLDAKSYWYALHPDWLKHIDSAENGFFILGCTDRTEAFALPNDFVKGHLEDFYTTNDSNRFYYHINLLKIDGKLALQFPLKKTFAPVDNFAFLIG
jgi:hypothetical protein